MANPQLKDGYLMLANEIVEALMRTNLSAYQSRIIWAIWRKTYGWRKKEDWLSNKQLVEMTGIRKQHVSRTVKELLNRNIVTKSGYKIAFNKDYTQWRELPKQVTLPKEVTKVTNLGNKVTNSGEHKIHLYKRHNNIYSPKSNELAELLASLIVKNNPSYRYLSNGNYVSTVKRWSEDIDKMIRLDQRPLNEIGEVIRWCQADSFWSLNILSGIKLRQHYDRLKMQMRKNKPYKEERLADQYPTL